MSVLRNRIINGASDYYPDLKIKGIPNAPVEMPLRRIVIYPGVVTYEDVQTLVASDGAPYMASTPGRWGQLYSAGSIS